MIIMIMPQILKLPDDALLYIYSYLPSTTLFEFRTLCRRLYAIPSGRRMNFLKAYEELWNLRFMNQPIKNIKSLPAEKLEKEVNRSYRLEQNLNRKVPVPVRYHHLTEAQDPLLTPQALHQDYLRLYIAKGNYLFIQEEDYLLCLVYFRSGRLECMWTSDELSFDDNSYTTITGTSYMESGQEISVVIIDGYIFYFHLADGDEDVLATESSSPGPVVLIRQYHLGPVEKSSPPGLRTNSSRGEWVTYESSSGLLIHNCRTNVNWQPQCPDHKHEELEQQQQHKCCLYVNDMFFMGERLLLCLWKNNGTERSNALALYLIPSDSGSDQHHDDEAAFQMESNILIAAAFTILDSPLPVLTISPFTPCQDIPSADNIEKCVRESKESSFIFHFVSSSDVEHRFATSTFSALLSVEPSTLRLQAHVFRVYDELTDRVFLNNIVYHHKSIVIDIVDVDSPPWLYVYHVDHSKAQQFMDAIFESRLTGPSSSSEARISHCGFATDLRAGLRRVWIKMWSDIRKVSEVRFDLESGRLFLICSDGIRVIDYV